MTTADDLIALVRTYNPRTNEALLRDAFDEAFLERSRGKARDKAGEAGR